MLAYLESLRRMDRNVRLFLVSVAVVGFTVFGGIFPTLVNLFLRRLGYGPEFIGVFNSAGSMAMALFCLIAGALGARWGSRRMMVAGLLLLALGNTSLSLVEFISAAWRQQWLISMNILSAMGISLYVVNSSPFLMGITADNQRNLVFSVQSGLGPLMAFGGSLVGGFLPDMFAGALGLTLDQAAPYRYTLLVSAIVIIPAALALLPTPEVRAMASGGAVSGAAPIGLMVLLSIVVLLQVAGEGIGRTFFNLYLDADLRLPTSQIGLLAGLGQLLAAPAAFLTPLLMLRLGNERTYLFATVGMAASLLPLALIPHWGAAGVGFAGLMALAAVTRPALMVYSMQIVAPTWRAVMSGATATAVGLSWAIMGFSGGYMIAGWGYTSLFSLGALLTLVGAMLFWLLFRKPRHLPLAADVAS